ncbi:tautomerase family protein [Micromonospora sp. NBC_01699]|uniref:tautomerase family protein n=1 Tax=Micromonospora sp. NBC_01699 TaxID=2975984 RepID=UPI002E29EAE1|nr:tautomerase family protein [Micromonospora sp. NBC_01699]
MPFVDISLARGKSREYLEGVSNAVHEALVAEFGMQPGDRFQLVHQHEPDEMIFNRSFRGGPRSDDFVVFTITVGLDLGELAKRRFYKTLVRLLGEGPGVQPADVFVMIHVTPPVNFSFADGVAASEVAAAEALDRAATGSGTRAAYTKTEMVDAIIQLFKDNDRSRMTLMLRDDFVLKVPKSLPYGGEFTGPEGFGTLFDRVTGASDYYESFVTDLTRVIEGEDHLIAAITVTGRGKKSGKSLFAENMWLFDIADGNFVRAQIYPDTAAAVSAAG